MEEKIEGVFCRGDLVFAKVRGYPPWPGQVEGVAGKSSKEVKYDILFFGTFERATCKESDIFHFEVNKEKYGKSRRRGFLESFEQIEEAARERASHMASSRELPEETPTNIMKKEKCSEIPIEGNSLPIPGSETAVLGDVSIHQTNFVVKEEPECIEIKEEPLFPLSYNISCEEPLNRETLGEDIKEPATFEMGKEKAETLSAGPSSHIFQSDIIDSLFKRKASSFDETDTRSSASVMESRVSINQTNIVVKEEQAGIEVKDEPLYPLSSSISCEEPVKNETVHGDILETRICHLKREKESEEGCKSSVDPLPVSGSETPQVEMYPYVEAAETGVSGMKDKLEINSFDSFRSDAPGQLSLDIESGLYTAETQRPVMTQMDSTREFTRGTSCLEIASSLSQSAVPGATGMSTQEHSSVPLQNLHSKTSFAMAYCFTATGGYLLERQIEEQVAEERQRQEEEQIASEKQMHEEEQAAGVRQKTLDNQSGSERGVSIEVTLPEWEMQKCASVSCSNEKSVRKSKVKAFECSACKKSFPSKVLHTVKTPYMCSLCEKSISHKHPATLQTGEKPYKCSRCEKTFSQRGCLFSHMRLHTGEKPFQCSQCEKSFSHKQNLTLHMRLHTGEKPYNCSHCQKSFSRRDHLKIHMQLHTGEKPFQCSLCEKSFSQRGHFDSHMRLHTGEKPYSCSQCQKSFSRRDQLKIHMHRHTAEKPFQCSLCEKSFSQRGHFDSHMRLHTGEKPYSCSQCQKSFSRRDQLKIHMHLHTGEKPFQCSHCKKSFSERSTLTRHLRLHTGEKPFQCSQCENSFSHKQSLILHMRVHTGEKHYNCSRCEKIFSQRGHLDRHMRLHIGEKPFQCSQCENSFSHKQSLILHMRVHTGEKPYICSRCEKIFSQRGLLDRHMRLHTGEKPYKCSLCKKSFTERSKLTRHMHLHTGEKPYNCSLCEKSFARGDVLTKHMRLHTGEKPYNCSQCQKSFSRRDHLKLHMRLHTRE